MKKRLLGFLTALALAVSMTACSDNDASSSKASSATTTPGTTSVTTTTAPETAGTDGTTTTAPEVDVPDDGSASTTTTTAPSTSTTTPSVTTSSAATTLYEKTEQSVMYVRAAVNVRSKPDASSERIVTLGTGAAVTVVGQSGNWYAINYNGKVCFVSKNFITSQKPATTTSTTTTAPSSQKPNTTTTTAGKPSVSTPEVEEVRGFKVSGTKLLDANGNEFVFRGVNHAYTWYRDKTKVSLDAIAATGSNTVRIVLSDGQVYSRDDVNSVKNLVEMCKERNLICVLEVHDITGNDSIAALEATCNYWISIKDALIGNEEYVILNIANEWLGNWDNIKWRDGYTSVIPKLRNAGIKNTIMVDSAGWGQGGGCIAQFGKAVFNSDVLKNTMFSVHMYGTAGKNAQTISSNLKGATDQNLCVCVGEFGFTHGDGDVDEAYILEYCEKNDIGYLAWSWKGNSGGVEYLDLAKEWDGSVLSSNWGEIVINGINGIRKTSEICSVFD